MGSQGENVADKDRYAFLLGSALKNNDLEQFFCIYDSIIPRDLPKSEVENIKEKARYIAELPEEEFNELVVNARNYSLAQGRPTPPSPSAMSNSEPHIFVDLSDNEGDHRDCHTWVPQLNLHVNSISSIGGRTTGMADDDSGLPSSTRSGCCISRSSEDTVEFPLPLHLSDLQPAKEKDLEENKTKKPRLRPESVIVTHAYNPQYDEEIMVEQDNESVESPRSDASSTLEYEVTRMDSEDQGIEMTTFRSESRGYYESNDRDEQTHQRLFNQHSVGSVQNMERPRAGSTPSIPVTRSIDIQHKSNRYGSCASSGIITSVDDSVTFPLGTPLAQSRCSPDFTTAIYPPFGNDENLLKKVGNSINSLMQSSSSSFSQDCAGAYGSAGDSKKKKKKKKESKDESTQEGGNRSSPLTKDVNGNPVSLSEYRQMRETPRSLDSISPVLGSRGRGSVGITNHDFPSNKGNLQEMGNKSENPTSPTGSSSNGYSEKRKVKKNVRNPGKDIHPEEDPNYVGNIENIDELVKFINNDIDGKKLKKIISKFPADGSANGTIAATTASLSKPQKKSKDRNKSKQCQTAIGESVEPHSSELETAQLLTSVSSLTSSYSSINEHNIFLPSEQASSCENSRTDSPNVQTLVKEMGNSSTSERPDDGKYEALQKDVETVVPSETIIDASCDDRNDKNHMFRNTKSAFLTKKDQVSEINEKGKPKVGSKDTKSESTLYMENFPSRKSKSKISKSDVKAALVSEKLSTEIKKVVKVDTSQHDGRSKELRVVSSLPGSVTQKTSAKFDLASENNDFMFTDVDLFSKMKEPEFTLVSKKKKRSPTQLVTSGQSYSIQSCPIQSTKDSYHLSTSHSSSFVPYNKTWQREAFFRPPFKHRSFTPPPFPVAAESDNIDKTRDLSPSAFPVLETTGRTALRANPLGTEARRRSLEDVTFDTGQLFPFDKDSDKESTKSLPADKGGGYRGRASFTVSYATMVSTKTPRQSVDSSKAESVTSSMEDANIEKFAVNPTTCMKWKGSPQERRHSIGSAPEELSKITSGSSLQRSGSQEVLTRDTDCLDKNVAAVISVAKGMTLSDSAGSFAGSDVDSARGSEGGSEITGEVFALPPAEESKVNLKQEKETKMAEFLGKSDVIPVVSMPSTLSETVSCSGSSSILGQPITSHSRTAEQPKVTLSNPNSRSHSSTVITSSKAETSRNSHFVTKPVNNGHKNKKSVVFCNSNHCDAFPMDVSFGGEPVFNLDEEMESESTEVNIASDDTISVSVEPVNASFPPAQALATDVSSTSDLNSSTKPPKGPHISRLNGLVSLHQSDSKPSVVPHPSATVLTAVSSAPVPEEGQTVLQACGPGLQLEGQSPSGASVASQVSSKVLPAKQHLLPNQVTSPVHPNLPKGGILMTIRGKIPDQKPENKLFVQPSGVVNEAVNRSQMDAIINFLDTEWKKLEKQRKKADSSIFVYNNKQGCAAHSNLATPTEGKF